MEVGYKVFNPDWTCRGFKYEVGKTYEMKDEPILCKQGFHYCIKLIDCFSYYQFDNNNKVAKIIAHGTIDGINQDKHCTNKIEIVEEISWFDVLNMVNTGKDNVGLGNSGNLNSGNRNSGDRNSGNRNSGNRNSGNRCTGVFCTENGPFRMFNKSTDWTYENWKNSRAFDLLYYNLPRFKTVEWIDVIHMSDDEKKANPNYETAGGYLKVLDTKESNQTWNQTWWDSLSKEDKKTIMSLPNFDKDIFKKCTGITIV